MGARELIAEARRLDAVATPGPWFVRRTGQGMDRLRATAIVLSDTDPVCWTDEDYVFAALARTLMPALADELEAALARERSVQATNETLARSLNSQIEKRAALTAPLDALSEGERDATMLWLQAAMQQGPAMVRRGAAALLEIVRADIL